MVILKKLAYFTLSTNTLVHGIKRHQMYNRRSGAAVSFAGCGNYVHQLRRLKCYSETISLSLDLCFRALFAWPYSGASSPKLAEVKARGS